MSKVVSLSRIKKARARAEKRRTSDANAIKFGRTKSEKAADLAATRREIERLNAHKRDDD